MSDRPGLFSTENLPTIVGVAFVLSLLSMAVVFSSTIRTNSALGAVARMELAAAKLDNAHNTDIKDLKQQVADLQGKISKLESAAAAPPAAPAPDAAAPPAK